MGIQRTEVFHEWNYFLAIERDLSVVSRYVDFSELNYDTFSLEIARLLLAAASEVDVVAKSLCTTIDNTKNAENITAYREIICGDFPQIGSMQVSIPRFGLTLNPWERWDYAESPIWWRAYNKVKHQRMDHYEKASLKNVLNAIGGLFLLNLLLGKKKDVIRLDPIPDLFDPPESIAFIAPSIQGRVGLFFNDSGVR